jgi:hypothetical protein
MIARWVLAAIAIAVVAVAVWDDRHGPDPAALVNVTPRHPELVDLRAAGAFRDVHLGEFTAGVVRTLGPPTGYGTSASTTQPPAGAELPGGPAGAVSLGYTDLGVYTRDDRVVWIVVTSPDAQTRRGIGVGDSLALARRAYPLLRCDQHDSSTDEGPTGPPICRERVRQGLNIELIDDPIDTIVIHGTQPKQQGL